MNAWKDAVMHVEKIVQLALYSMSQDVVIYAFKMSAMAVEIWSPLIQIQMTAWIALHQAIQQSVKKTNVKIVGII